MRVILSTVVAVAVASSAVITQTPPPMKPGPEQKRIGYFAGKWNYQGEAKASPLGPAGSSLQRTHASGSPAASIWCAETKAQDPGAHRRDSL